jgi:glycosyltransferase involved in cell wall biosynthesis
LKLAIISHTEHYKTEDGNIVGWGPTISEINNLANEFELIYHVAFFHEGTPPPSSLQYTEPTIIFIPLPPTGGKSLKGKLSVLFKMPESLSIIRSILNKVDCFQVRTPLGMGVFLIPYLTFFSNKKGWYKYAGSWTLSNAPLAYRFQRWMLKKQSRKVTINGSWPNQLSHCITFENPCLTEQERKDGETLVESKSFFGPLSFCFVGRLEDEKGVHILMDAFSQLGDKRNIKSIELIGDGTKRSKYEKRALEIELPFIFHGFLSRNKVFELYKKCHFIVLPSQSEGFPKVIAEAMNFGCIPIVSDISSIGQYVNRENGYLIKNITASSLLNIFNEITATPEAILKKKALLGYRITNKFTFENYRNRVFNEILN